MEPFGLLCPSTIIRHSQEPWPTEARNKCVNSIPCLLAVAAVIRCLLVYQDDGATAVVALYCTAKSSLFSFPFIVHFVIERVSPLFATFKPVRNFCGILFCGLQSVFFSVLNCLVF